MCYEVVAQPVHVALHRARQQPLLRDSVELREEQRREPGAAAVGHHTPIGVVKQVGSQLLGVGVGLVGKTRLDT